MKYFTILLIVSQMLLYAGKTTAQSMLHDGEGPSVKTEVALVPIDVLVRDKTGTLIDNLRKEDFVVYDNGVAQQIAHFSHEEVPLDVALVIKSSFSTSPYILDYLDAILKMLQDMSSKNDHVALFYFNAIISQLSGLTQNHLLHQYLIKHIPCYGGGANNNGVLWKAAHYLRSKDPDRRNAIILISDNYESGVREWNPNTKETLDEILGARAFLYSIQIPNNERSKKDHNIDEITLLSQKTGGAVIEVGSTSNLHNILSTAITSLKHSYTLGFYPSDQGKEGSYHKLIIKLPSFPDYTVQAREGYYVADELSSKTDNKTSSSSFNFNTTDLIAGMERHVVSMSMFMRDEDIDNYNSKEMNPINFTASAKSFKDSKGKRKTIIDIEIDTKQLLCIYKDGQYHINISVGVVNSNNTEMFIKRYTSNYSEKKILQTLQSKISLSMQISQPVFGNIRLFIMQPEFVKVGVKIVPFQ